MFRSWSLKRIGGRAALLAMLAQLMLTCGHIHADELGFSAPSGAGVAQAQAQVPQPDNPAGDPAGHQPDADHCALCAALALAGALVLPGPVGLPEPPAAGRTSVATFSSFSVHQAPFLLFRTRAPPLV